MAEHQPSSTGSGEFEYVSGGAASAGAKSERPRDLTPSTPPGGRSAGPSMREWPGLRWSAAIVLFVLALMPWPALCATAALLIAGILGQIQPRRPDLVGLASARSVTEGGLGSTRAVVSADTLAAPYRAWVEEGCATQAEIAAVVERLPETLRQTFQPLSEQANDLVGDLERLARATQQIDAYLDGPHGTKPAADAARLRGEIAAAEDAIVRDQLERALHALEQTLADQRDIRTLRDRTRAEALHINASLESVLSQVIKQRYTDVETAREEYQSATERLRSVKSQVDAIQQVITSRPFASE